MTRKTAIGGNWKMNLDLAGALTLAGELRNRLGSQRQVEVLIFPPYPFLQPVVERLRDSAIAVGGQDLWLGTKGAFTSGVSAPMLRSVGCTHVLIGHSERRAVFGDNDAMVARKLRAALDGGLKPVLCVGETLEQRKSGETFAVVTRQLDSAFEGLQADALGDLIIAYEPVWAIGTGLTATPEQAQDVHADIRARVAHHYGSAFAEALRLQYGGSVKGSNAAGLLGQTDIDGALVGGASLKAEEFAAIVRARAAV